MEGQENNVNPQNMGSNIGSMPTPAPAPAPMPTPPAPPQPVYTPSQPVKEGGSSAGLIVALVVILALVVLGGLYFWGQRITQEENMLAPTEDQTTASIKAQGTTDDAASLEDDLNSTNVDTLDAEINAS